MKNRACATLTLFAVLPFIGAQSASQQFKTVESGVVGLDLSRYDEKIKDAVAKASQPGAGAREKLAAASALMKRASYFYSAGRPPLYKFALGDFRNVLRFQPDNAEAKEHADEIISIYQSLGRPVPENGNAEADGRYLVEVFKTTPKQITFETDNPYLDANGSGLSDGTAYVYEFAATAGKSLSVDITSSNNSAVFDLILEGADNSPVLVSGAKSKHHVPLLAGKYLIRVYVKLGKTDYEEVKAVLQ
jgi:hypothetical protein